MIFVVDKETNKILYRVDAWNSFSDMLVAQYCEENGYKILDSSVTFMGDMIVYVEVA